MKWEIEGKDIIAWLISLIPLLIFYLVMWYGGYKESQTLIKEDIDINEWEKLPEIINKKEEIENQEREKKEENDNLREQLRDHEQREYRYKNDSKIYCGIPDDEQNINDSTRRKEAIEEIERYLSSLLYAYKKKRINFKITEQILPKSWKIDFDNKSGKEIIEWRDRLIKMIDDEKAKEKRHLN